MIGWFAVRSHIQPSEVRAMTRAETAAVRKAVERLVKTDAEYDQQRAQLGGCALRRKK